MPEKILFVALGSNLGEPRGNVLEAMRRLEQWAEQPLLKSSLWETTPVACPPGSSRFVNAVVAWSPRPTDTPESVMTELQRLEKEFGRVPKILPNESRPLDLDLIAFGDEVRATPQLSLPHPRAHERRFVLQPLSEIAPDFALPGQRRTVSQLLEKLPPDPGMKRIRT